MKMPQIKGVVKLKNIELKENTDMDTIIIMITLEKWNGEVFKLRQEISRSVFVFTNEEWKQMGAEREEYNGLSN